MWSSSHLLGTSWLLVVVAVCFHLVDAQAFSIQDQEPQSVHLVYGKAAATTTTGGGSVSGSELNIVWWTKGPITSAIVFYSLVDERDNHLPIDQIGCSHDAIEKGFIGRQATRGKYIHRVLIGNLLPARRYCYEITSGHASSDIYDFRTPPATAATNGSFLIDGWSSNTDNNNDAAANLTAQLSAAMRTPPYVHTLVHLPQLTLSPYADRPEVMYERDLLDEYASLLGHVPLLPTLGGDVDQQLFAGMLPVPLGSGSGGGAGGGGSYSYSVDINGVHLLTYSTDLFSLNEIDHANLSAILGDEMAWMEADLRRANANRARVPWLVVLLPNLIRCVEVACAHDKLNALKQRVELLFYQYGVDIIFESHAAAFYERFYPLVHTLDKYTTSFNRADMPVRIVLPRAATTASQDMFQLESIGKIDRLFFFLYTTITMYKERFIWESHLWGRVCFCYLKRTGRRIGSI